MRVSLFDRILVVERHRRQGSRIGFSVPALCEQEAQACDEPLLVTNMRGSFVQVRRSGDNLVRFSFSPCPLEQEAPLFLELFRSLWGLSEQKSWSNRCASITEGLDRCRSFGFSPDSVVIPASCLASVCGVSLSSEQVEQAMKVQGWVARVEGLKVLVSDLPDECSVVLAPPSVVGNCVRIHDSLGVVIRRSNQSLILVSANGLA